VVPLAVFALSAPLALPAEPVTAREFARLMDGPTSLFRALLWLAALGPASLAGARPPSIAETTLPVPVIQSLDLGVVLPSFALSAALLWKQRAWGYVFTGVLLVKGTTLGLAVLAMIVFMLQEGPNRPSPPDRAVRSLEPHWACPRDSIHPSHPTQSLQNPGARGS
jgi:hypothetical protein